ncbi:GTPase [Flavobacteriaceae bacterium TP-CH-4]|uniref:GTPase n=1 Tax=Pelagihabitans pacificus TaxID=2696054 RepID=A0A967AXE3_9FLAO|nr:GTPase [Pelagihabitans pacificus]NHF60895.1 GTPase [Pelagihabitans pacificus]
MESNTAQKLIFVYNSDAGFRNRVVDSAHKIFSPSTYECSLCNITYGTFAENRGWRQFRRHSDLQMAFLHRDEFSKAYKSKFGYKFTFPIVLVESSHGLDILIRTEELNALKKVEELIVLINERTAG